MTTGAKTAGTTVAKETAGESVKKAAWQGVKEGAAGGAAGGAVDAATRSETWDNGVLNGLGDIATRAALDGTIGAVAGGLTGAGVTKGGQVLRARTPDTSSTASPSAADSTGGAGPAARTGDTPGGTPKVNEGGRRGVDMTPWRDSQGRDITPKQVEALRQKLLRQGNLGTIQNQLKLAGVEIDPSELQAIKNYLFDSRGLNFTPQNYEAWNRLASGRGTVFDARFIVHEQAELRLLQKVQQETGFDFMGRDWDHMSRQQQIHWQRDFDRYYGQTHARALEVEYDFLVQQLSKYTDGKVNISRTVFAAVDETWPEGRQRMLVSGIPVQDHRSFPEWKARGAQMVDLGGGRLMTLSSLVTHLKSRPLKELQ
ncbi:hypothetical protein ACLESO_52040 [Pyxidicoccus sp. 3LG]